MCDIADDAADKQTAEQLTAAPRGRPVWSTPEKRLYRAGYRVGGSELYAVADTDTHRRRAVRWSMGAVGFIGATLTGIAITEALHYLWQFVSMP